MLNKYLLNGYSHCHWNWLFIIAVAVVFVGSAPHTPPPLAIGLTSLAWTIWLAVMSTWQKSGQSECFLRLFFQLKLVIKLPFSFLVIDGVPDQPEAIPSFSGEAGPESETDMRGRSRNNTARENWRESLDLLVLRPKPLLPFPRFGYMSQQISPLFK